MCKTDAIENLSKNIIKYYIFIKKIFKKDKIKEA